MTAISGRLPFTAPRAAEAPAQAADDAGDAKAGSAFRAMFHDATRPHGHAGAPARGGSDARRDDTHAAAPAATSPDDPPTTTATTDDAQTIAAQQAAIAQALALPGTPAAPAPATAMTTPAADGKLGELGHAPTGKAATPPTAHAAPAPQPTAAWLLGMPAAPVATTQPAAAGKPSAIATTKIATAAAATAQVASSASTLASRLEAALGHGLATAGHAGPAGHAAPTAAAHAAAAKAAEAAAALTPAADPTAATALTPLEQSVHDLISEISDDRGAGRGHARLDADDPTADPTPAADPSAAIAPSMLAAPTATPTAITAPSRAAELDPTRAASLAQPAELPSNPSHVHLVLDDGPERVVMTVAVRGSDIHVALRASDDATTNALARNAASLDHAMRARGLQLGQLTTERDPPRDHTHNRPSPDDEPSQARRERHAKPDAERFTLEEIR